MNPYQNEQMNNLLKYLTDAGERNVTEKRNNFEHLTLLVATILGFSVGLAATSNGESNCFLIASWVAQVIALIIGSAYLILETDSRYYRIIASAGKQAELINVNSEAELKEKARALFSDAQKIFFDVSSGRNLKEKIQIAFTKYQGRLEMFFYAMFVVSLVLLIASFF